MISEKGFIKKYPGFWNSLFPLHKTFIRGVALECAQNHSDLEIITTGRRFSFVSEVGFQLFAQCNINDIPISDIIFRDALYLHVENLCQSKFELFLDDEPSIRNELEQEEFADAIKIAQTLYEKFSGKETVINPRFIGCGFLDTCYGDVLCHNTLYEVKTVSRSFSAKDFRQLITYCALNHISKQYNITSIGLFNPKKNTMYEINLEWFASAIAGVRISDMYWEIVNFITREDTSK